MKTNELKKILEFHQEWLRDAEHGIRANLRGANLRGADLTDANLTDANLRGADLRGANLTGADLTDADLRGAYLRGANLRGADLTDANLTDANLTDAYLRGADLTDADLRGADLTDADLRGANLRGADLTDANLTDANLTAFYVCPEVGSFTGWKKLSGGTVAELLIPAEAKRVSSLVGRKCRAEFVTVVQIHGEQPVKGSFDIYSGKLRYTVGKTIYPDTFDDNIAVECTNGIHFFVTRAEAENY